MKRFRLLKVPLLLLAVAACGGPDPAPAGAPADAPAAVDSAAEDDLILRLSGELVAEPRTPAERDRNAIVNYAIDSLLDVQATPSGLFYQLLDEGEGEPLAWGDRVRVHYRGAFLDGRVFDSSYRRGEPLEFYIGNMIAGWNEGLQLLRPGGKALLIVPAHLGYGEEGLTDSQGKVIVPPGKVLVFQVEVVDG